MEQEMDITLLTEVSEIELVYKSKVKPSRRPKIVSSSDAFRIFMKYWDQNKIELQEQFSVMFLNKAYKVLAIYQISTGGITGTVADPKLIFSAALKLAACSIILCHNHPSSNYFPSTVDKSLTEKIKQAGNFLDIKLLEHIIITGAEGYYSMSDHGLI